MFGFGKVACVVCDRLVSVREAIRLRDRNGFVVCKSCVERWDQEGRTCKRCNAPVHGPQEPGVFLDRHAVLGRHAFGHYDCGASRFAA